MFDSDSDQIRLQISNGKEVFSPLQFKRLAADLASALKREAADETQGHPDLAALRAQLAALSAQAEVLPEGHDRKAAAVAAVGSTMAQISALSTAA